MANKFTLARKPILSGFGSVKLLFPAKKTEIIEALPKRGAEGVLQ